MKSNSQMSLVMPTSIYDAVRRDAAQRGLSMAAYVRLILSTAQQGGDVRGLFTAPPQPTPAR